MRLVTAILPLVDKKCLDSSLQFLILLLFSQPDFSHFTNAPRALAAIRYALTEATFATLTLKSIRKPVGERAWIGERMVVEETKTV